MPVVSRDPRAFDDVRPFTLQMEPPIDILVVAETNSDVLYLVDALDSFGKLKYRTQVIPAGRLIGSAMPYLVPVIAALLGNLFNAMMFGIIGAVLSLLFALFLPETAGRKFAVIEGKEHG